ncbi:MAG: hypothetical protein M2R45_03388 [Verrucomicrobia subdivision 3 bacterium]|nr:hypothetical protein [Limisphaerales bacterium]MCS1416700.1 hypothetical protein [Limisphaerales bacterium]
MSHKKIRKAKVRASNFSGFNVLVRFLSRKSLALKLTPFMSAPDKLTPVSFTYARDVFLKYGGDLLASNQHSFPTFQLAWHH